MPLPLPNLDTRRWADLVEEGRALIPRYAPEWTDHNIHDPGIALIELFAWLVEREMYRANRVPARHRRQFLALAGFAPAPPRPASAVLGMTPMPGTGTLTVPAGLVLHAAPPAGGADALAAAGPAEAAGVPGVVPFTVLHETTLIEIGLVAVQVFDGQRFVNRTRAAREGMPFPALGSDPRVPRGAAMDEAPALYLGFDRSPPPGQPFHLYFAFAGAVPGERRRVLEEYRKQREGCTPAVPAGVCVPCPPSGDPACGDEEETGTEGDGSATAVWRTPRHHAAKVVWEYHAGGAWHRLDEVGGDVAGDTATSAEVHDTTRALTLDGAVVLTLPEATDAVTFGAIASPSHWVRCRLLAAPYESAPMITDLVINAVSVAQRMPVWRSLPIAAGAAVTGMVVPETAQRLSFTMTATGTITSLRVLADGADAPALLVLDYLAPTPTAPGSITLPLVPVQVGTGLPEQHATLADVPLADGHLQLWTVEGERWHPWQADADLHAATAASRVAMLDAVAGALAFGDGVHGRVPPAGAPIVATHDRTLGARGNLSEARAWSISETIWNAVQLGEPAASFTAQLAGIANPVPAAGGADAEPLEHAAGRATAALQAHERLVELLEEAGGETLDQVERAAVIRRTMPARAATAIDFERIALEIPGTRIRRARAWVGYDPAYACVDIAGTVTLVIVPELPHGRPVPSPGLITAVRRYLHRRRTLCTRVVVMGPEYVEVRARAVVRAVAGADAARVRDDVAAALAAFFDPLTGGPGGHGWPFGRDVYRSEVLAVIDGVPGVDHVLALELSVGDEAARCGNICVPLVGLVTSGMHEIRVEDA